VRPFTRECLELANKHFEVGIFTAAQQEYADIIINYLDPTGQLIQHRFYNNHTNSLTDLLGTQQVVFKDLSFLKGEVDLARTLLIDNNLYCFAYHLENGIPILNYEGNQQDRCLLQVMQYLLYIKDFEDMAAENDRIYQLRKLYDSDFTDFIKFYYSQNNTSRSSASDSGSKID